MTFSKPKLFKFVCKNCRAELCETDGTYLFVENLEVLPKVRTRRRGSSADEKVVKDLICPCGESNRIYLKKPPDAEIEKPESERRKFSIFRSQFE